MAETIRPRSFLVFLVMMTLLCLLVTRQAHAEDDRHDNSNRQRDIVYGHDDNNLDNFADLTAQELDEDIAQIRYMGHN